MRDGRRDVYVAAAVAIAAARRGLRAVVVACRATLPRSRPFARSVRCSWRRVPDVGLEGQPADPARQRLDAVGLVRRQPDGAAAARPRSRGRSSRSPASWTQCTYQGQAARIRSTAPLQHGRRGRSRWRRPACVYRRSADRRRPSTSLALAKPLVGAIATYFCVNTGSSPAPSRCPRGRSVVARVARRLPVERAPASWWRAAPARSRRSSSQRGEHWKAVLLLAPIYLTYRTYQLFVGRLEDQKRHIDGSDGCTGARRGAGRQTQAGWRAEQAPRAAADASASPEGSVPGHRLARAAHAAERDPRLGRHAAHAACCRSRGATAACEAILRQRAAAGAAHRRPARRGAHHVGQAAARARRRSMPRDVVRGALEIVQPAAEAKGITHRASISIRPSAPFYGDGARLQQVLWNLLSNAVKFTPEGGAVTCALGRARRLTARSVVADYGAGHSARLPAVRSSSRSARPTAPRRGCTAGSGWASSIVKQLVEAHGGSVDVDSAGEGHGRDVHRAAADRARASSDRARAPVGVAQRRRDAPTRSKGSRCWWSTTTRTAATVVAAHLEAHQATRADRGVRGGCASTCCSASTSTCCSPTSRCRARTATPDPPGARAAAPPRAPSIPAAALTAFARDEDRAAALEAGFQLHLAKPIDAASLVAAVATLGRSRAYRLA